MSAGDAYAVDPRPEDFRVIPFAQACEEADAYIYGGGPMPAPACTEGTHRCPCGRVYGVYRAGGPCFVANPPGTHQVDDCVRCGRRLALRDSGRAVQLELLGGVA